LIVTLLTGHRLGGADMAQLKVNPDYIFVLDT